VFEDSDSDVRHRDPSYRDTRVRNQIYTNHKLDINPYRQCLSLANLDARDISIMSMSFHRVALARSGAGRAAGADDDECFEPHSPRPVIECQFIQSLLCPALDFETYNKPASHSAISILASIKASPFHVDRRASRRSLDIFISSLAIDYIRNLTLSPSWLTHASFSAEAFVSSRRCSTFSRSVPLASFWASSLTSLRSCTYITRYVVE